MTDLEGYTLQYETEFDGERRKIVQLIAKKSTQQQRADKFGVSIRTIQHFENLEKPDKCRNHWLLFCYRMDVYGDATV